VRIAWPKRCPRCGSRQIVDVLYGTPDDPELRELVLQGKFLLRPGRCGDGPPGWACFECGLESKELAEARAS
jgi:hypothetical protein